MKQRLYKACIILTVFLAACSNSSQNAGTEIATPVSVVELKKGSISKLINSSGTAQASYGVELVSEMSGEYNLRTNPATGKPFKLGDRVQKGQVVIRLEGKEYENNIALDAKKLALDIASAELTKQKALYEQGGITLSEVRNTEVRVINAQHDLEGAQINLEKMEIRAPFNGVIVNLPYYSPGVKVDQSKPMLGLMDYSNLYMEINLPESAIGYIRRQQPVYITHYTLPGDTLSGVIDEISPAISNETRTFKGKILIRNSELKLRPGMFVKADIVVEKADSAIIIPKDVIQTSRQRKIVYIVDKNTAFQREITIGLEDENNAQVLTGLAENENLVVRGYETLRDNSKVKIQR